MKREILLDSMSKKYDFWKSDHPDLNKYPSDFWALHKPAEMAKRQNHLDLLTKHVDEIQNKQILDLGIAWGMWPHLMTEYGAKVCGVDYAKLYTTDGLKLRHPTLSHVCAFDFTTQAWPFEDNSFDVITHLDLIEHVHPPLKHMLDEMYRVLKPGGTLIMTTPNFTSLRKRASMLIGKSPISQIERFYCDDPFIEHIKEYTISELEFLLSNTKFKIDETSTFDHLYYYQFVHASKAKKLIFKIYKQATNFFPSLKDTIAIVGHK